MAWNDITISDEYKQLSPRGRARLKQRFFEESILPDLATISPEGQEKAFNRFMETPDDTGEGLIRSALGSAARGFFDPLAAAPEVAGAYLGIEGLEEFGGDVRGAIEGAFPVNPAEQGLVTDVAGVLGQVGQIVATGGGGAVAGAKLLGRGATEAAKRQAMRFGATAAQQTAMGSSAVAGGLERAEQLGLEGGDRLLRGAIAGGTELLAERLGGFATELGGVGKAFGFGSDTIESGFMQPIIRGMVTEIPEEMGVETAGQLTDIAMAPETAPAFDFGQTAYAGLLGAVGGVAFGGIEAAITPRTKKAFDGTTDFIPSSGPPPGMTVEDAEEQDLLKYGNAGEIIGYVLPVSDETIEGDLPLTVDTNVEPLVENVAAAPEASATASALRRIVLGDTESGLTDAGMADATANLLTGIPMRGGSVIDLQGQRILEGQPAPIPAQAETVTPAPVAEEIITDQQDEQITQETLQQEQSRSQELQEPRELPILPAEQAAQAPEAAVGAETAVEVAAWKGVGKSPSGAASSGLGFFATDSKEYAKEYASDEDGLRQVSVSIRNPYQMDFQEFRSIDRGTSDKSAKEIADELKAAGHDGIVVTHSDGAKEYIAFSKDQIKEQQKATLPVDGEGAMLQGGDVRQERLNGQVLSDEEITDDILLSLDRNGVGDYFKKSSENFTNDDVAYNQGLIARWESLLERRQAEFGDVPIEKLSSIYQPWARKAIKDASDPLLRPFRPITQGKVISSTDFNDFMSRLGASKKERESILAATPSDEFQYRVPAGRGTGRAFSRRTGRSYRVSDVNPILESLWTKNNKLPKVSSAPTDAVPTESLPAGQLTSGDVGVAAAKTKTVKASTLKVGDKFEWFGSPYVVVNISRDGKVRSRPTGGEALEAMRKLIAGGYPSETTTTVPRTANVQIPDATPPPQAQPQPDATPATQETKPQAAAPSSQPATQESTAAQSAAEETGDAGVASGQTVSQNGQNVSYEVDEQLLMRSPFTNEDSSVSFRGVMPDGKAVVWTGKTQMAVPIGWLRRTGESLPISEVKAGGADISAIAQESQSEPSVTAPTDRQQPLPLPKTKDGLIAELIGPIKSDYVARQAQQKTINNYKKFSKDELLEMVKDQRVRDAEFKRRQEVTSEIIQEIKGPVNDAGAGWVKLIKEIAKANGIEDYSILQGNSRGEEIYRIASRIADRGDPFINPFTATKPPTQAQSQPAAGETGDAGVAISPTGETVESSETPSALSKLQSYISTLSPKAQAAWTPERLAAAESYYVTGNESALEPLTATQRKIVMREGVSESDAAAYEAEQKRQFALRNPPAATDSQFIDDYNAYVNSLSDETLQKERESREEAQPDDARFSKILRSADGNIRRTGVKSTPARAARNSYIGVIPGVENTWLGTIEEFDAEFPDGYPFDSKTTTPPADTEALVAEDGRAFIFIDRVQVLDGDAERAEQHGTSPGVEAIKRLLRHESFVHRGFMSLPGPLKARFADFVASGVIPEAELDYLVSNGYPQYKGWRDNKTTEMLAAEEWLAQRVERMGRIPQSGPIASIMDWLRDVWRWLTGGETTDLDKLRNTMRAMHKALGALDPKQRIVMELPDMDVLRRSYIGERAIENMPEERKQFMRDSLDTAKAMAATGKSSEEIRAVTGWFIGKYDGKMRWEVPDNDAALRLDEYRAAREEGDSAREIVSRFYADKRQRDMEEAQAAVVGKPMEFIRELSKKLKASQQSDAEMLQSFYAGEENPNRVNNRVPLGYILDHPQLFEMYPELKAVPVSFNAADASADATEDGSFNTSTGVLFLSPLGFIQKNKTLSTALHEIQHWIQGEEGFARGGNAEAMRKMNDFIGLAVNQSKLAKVLRDAADLQDSVGGFSNDVVSNLPQDQISIAFGAYNTIEDRWIPSDELRNEADKLDKKILDTDFTGYEAYRRLAGEIEARDIQARQNFTPAQRAATAPYSSENIAPEDAIVMFGGSGSQASTARRSVAQTQQDQEYLAAVERGDMETAQRMVDEAAITEKHGPRIGSIVNNLATVLRDGDSLTTEGNAYGFEIVTDEVNDGELYISWIENKDAPKKTVADVLRGLSDLFDLRLTPLGGSQEGYYESLGFVKKGKDMVLARISESADPVTYDSNGAPIPLSQRFQSTSSDIRYSKVQRPPISAQVPALTTDNIGETSQENKLAMEAMRDGLEGLPLKYRKMADDGKATEALEKYAIDMVKPYTESREKMLELLEIMRDGKRISEVFDIDALKGQASLGYIFGEAALQAERMGDRVLADEFSYSFKGVGTAGGQALAVRRLFLESPRYQTLKAVTMIDSVARGDQQAVVNAKVGKPTAAKVGAEFEGATEAARDTVADAIPSELQISEKVLELGAAVQGNPKLTERIKKVISDVLKRGILLRAMEKLKSGARKSIIPDSNIYDGLTLEEMEAELVRLDKGIAESIDFIENEVAKDAGKEKTPSDSAQRIIKRIIAKAKRKERKEGTPDPVEELYKADLKSPMNEADFIKKAVELGVEEDVALELKNAIDLQLTAKALQDALSTIGGDIERNIKKANEEANKFQKQADAIIEKVVNRMADPPLVKEKKAKAVDPLQKAYRDQLKKPVSREEFIENLEKINVFDQTASLLFDAAEMERASREAIAAARKQPPLPVETAKAIINRVQKQAAGEATRAKPKLDRVRLLYKAHLRERMAEADFMDEAKAAGLTPQVAQELYDAAELEIAAILLSKEVRGKSENYDKLTRERLKHLDVDSSALVEYINRLRREGKLGPVNWRDIMQLPPTRQQVIKGTLLELVKQNPQLQNLSAEEQQTLADALEKVWERERERQFKLQVKRLEMPGAKQEDQEKVVSATPRIIKLINQGMLAEDAFYKAVGEQFGIKEMSDADRKRIMELSEIIQDGAIPEADKAKEVRELVTLLQKYHKLTTAEILSNVWVAHVLSGVRTQTDMALGFLNGLLNTVKKAGLVIYKNPNAKGAKTAAKGIQQFFVGLADGMAEAARYVRTEEPGLVRSDIEFINSYLEGGLRKGGLSTARKLRESDNKFLSALGSWLAILERVNTGWDVINYRATYQGTLAMAHALNPKIYKEALMPTTADFKAMEERAKTMLGAGATRAQIKSRAFQYIEDGVHLLGKNLDESFMQEWKQMATEFNYDAKEAAMMVDPTGIGGLFYRGIMGITEKAETAAKARADKAKQELLDPTLGRDQRFIRQVFPPLMYLLASQARNILGVRFIRFTGNKINELISYIPIAGMARIYLEEGMTRNNELTIKAMSVQMNQLIAMTIMIPAFIRAMYDLEDDDEERGYIIQGPWDNLTPERKSQLMADGFKPNTIAFYDKKTGRWTSYNYINWPSAGWFATAGSVSDYRRYTPEKWDEKTAAAKFMSGIYAGGSSFLDISSISQMTELFGRSTYSTDPATKGLEKVTKLATGYAGGFVPRIAKDVDSWFDKTVYKPEDTWGHIAKEMPFYRRGAGKQLRDIFYEPVEISRTPWSRALQVSPDDPAYKALGRLNSRGIWLTPANPENRKVKRGGKLRDMTDEEANAYMAEVGKRYKEFVVKQGDRLLEMDVDRADELVSKYTARIREIAFKRAIATAGKAAIPSPE